MKILSIETSCDETAISIVQATGGESRPTFSVLGNSLYSQASLHAKYGGVFPNLAKREHTKNIAPLTAVALKDAGLLMKKKKAGITQTERDYLEALLSRDHGLADELISFFSTYKKPAIDYIAVTTGPGLEPALWVGINTAKALSHMWNISMIPVNHMEGHMLVSMLQTVESRKSKVKGGRASSKMLHIPPMQFPAIALLISGGHTELVLMKNWRSYTIIGATRDDAVGEAFDKVARMLALPYPGGPEISKLASTLTKKSERFTFPRPMIHSGDLDFSFSGIKTAVLYTIKKIPRVTTKMKAEIAHEFETAVTDVLVSKTVSALKKTKAKTLIIGGGVSANTRIRRALEKAVREKTDGVELFLPTTVLSTDNAIMIAISAYMQLLTKGEKIALDTDGKRTRVVADGNMTF